MIKTKFLSIIFLFFAITFFGNNNFISNWQYNVKITNPGTRSEGRIGRLYYKSKRIMYCFDYILTPIGEYSFQSSNYLWGFKGYKLTSHKTSHNYPATKQTSVALLKKIIKQGYYEGKEKYKGIKFSWIKVMRNNEYYWINPDIMKKFIKLKKWRSRSVRRFTRFYRRRLAPENSR